MNTTSLEERPATAPAMANGLEQIEKDARFAWGLVPASCKRSLIELERAGRLQESRPEILREAEAILKRVPARTLLDYCHALEMAAGRWLVEHPAPAMANGQGPRAERRGS